MFQRVSAVLAAVLSLIIISGCDGLFHERVGGGEAVYDLEQTEDGGYILAGRRFLDEHRFSALLTKTDGAGNEAWSQVFTIKGKDLTAYSVSQTGDGGYILAGIVENSYEDAFLIKTDGQGNEEWLRVLGGNLNDRFYCVQPTGDGGFIAAGSSWSYGESHYDAWLLKTDAFGNEEWSRVFGGDITHARFVLPAGDGGYILAGGYGDAWLLKTDSAGNEEWSQIYEESKAATMVQQVADGGFIAVFSAAPYSFSGSEELRLLKTDALGNEEWMQVFEAESSKHARSLQLTKDGGSIIAGGWGDAWLRKTDAFGNEEWLRHFEDSGSNYYGSAVRQAPDGGFILAGYGRPQQGGQPGAWLLKTDSLGGEEWQQAFGDEYVVGHSLDIGYATVFGLLIIWFILNLAYFLFFSRDMEWREEKKWVWLIRFMLVGPLAATWYLSCRKPTDSRAAGGSRLFHLSRNFIIQWTLYFWIFSASSLFVAAIFLSPMLIPGIFALLVTGAFLYLLPAVLAWLAVWLAPLLIAAIILFVTMPRRPWPQS